MQKSFWGLLHLCKISAKYSGSGFPQKEDETREEESADAGRQKRKRGKEEEGVYA
jgi:hypothetical protein